jgi:chromosome segregation ATPase
MMEPDSPNTSKENTMAVRKTPKQRAQEDLDTAVRMLNRAKERKEKVDAENSALAEKYERLVQDKRDEIVKAAEDLKALQKRVEFLGTHPDLNDDDEAEVEYVVVDDVANTDDDVL